MLIDFHQYQQMNLLKMLYHMALHISRVYMRNEFAQTFISHGSAWEMNLLKFHLTWLYTWFYQVCGHECPLKETHKSIKSSFSSSYVKWYIFSTFTVIQHWKTSKIWLQRLHSTTVMKIGMSSKGSTHIDIIFMSKFLCIVVLFSTFFTVTQHWKAKVKYGFRGYFQALPQI